MSSSVRFMAFGVLLCLGLGLLVLAGTQAGRPLQHHRAAVPGGRLARRWSRLLLKVESAEGLGDYGEPGWRTSKLWHLCTCSWLSFCRAHARLLHRA